MSIISIVRIGTLCSILFFMGNIPGADPCGENQTGESGRISFPEPESNYAHNKDCIWHVTALDNAEYLLITFQRFDINTWGSPKCGDFLQILRADNSTLMNRCDKPVVLENLKRALMGNKMTVHFHSDDVRTGKGFSLKWEVKKWRSTTPQPTTMKKQATTAKTTTTSSAATRETSKASTTTTTTENISTEITTFVPTTYVHSSITTPDENTTSYKDIRDVRSSSDSFVGNIIIYVCGFLAFETLLLAGSCILWRTRRRRRIIICVPPTCKIPTTMTKVINVLEKTYMSPICRPQAPVQPSYYESLSPYDDVIIVRSSTPGAAQNMSCLYSEVTYEEPQKTIQTYPMNKFSKDSDKEAQIRTGTGNERPGRMEALAGIMQSPEIDNQQTEQIDAEYIEITM